MKFWRDTFRHASSTLLKANGAVVKDLTCDGGFLWPPFYYF